MFPNAFLQFSSVTCNGIEHPTGLSFFRSDRQQPVVLSRLTAVEYASINVYVHDNRPAPPNIASTSPPHARIEMYSFPNHSNATGGTSHSPVSFFLLFPVAVETRGAEAGTTAVAPPNANEANGLSLTLSSLMFADPAAPSSAPDDSASLPSHFQALDIPCTMATHTQITQASLLPLLSAALAALSKYCPTEGVRKMYSAYASLGFSREAPRSAESAVFGCLIRYEATNNCAF